MLPVLVGKDLTVSIDMANVAGDITFKNANALLLAAEKSVADPFSEALIGGVLWKLCMGSDPNDPSRWRQRRMWLGRSGRLWYESLKDAVPQEFFDGVSVGHIDVTPLGDLRCPHPFGPRTPRPSRSSLHIDDQHLFAMEFTTRDGVEPTETKVFATESDEDRIKWIRLCKSFGHAVE